MNASSDRLLRRTLWGNAVFSVISGAVLVAFAAPFASWPPPMPRCRWRASTSPSSSSCWAGRGRLRRALRLGCLA